MKRVVAILVLLVLFLVLSVKKSGYACASTKDLLSVQAQGAQCYRCSHEWEGGDCVRNWPGGGRTKGRVSVYQAGSTIDNEMPGWLWWWDSKKHKPDPAYPPLWRTS